MTQSRSSARQPTLARQVLTRPSAPVGNGGCDNESADLILFVDDVLGLDGDAANRYLVLEALGQGSFGQVVKCRDLKTLELVAVKVIKNHPAYLEQGQKEALILQHVSIRKRLVHNSSHRHDKAEICCRSTSITT